MINGTPEVKIITGNSEYMKEVILFKTYEIKGKTKKRKRIILMDVGFNNLNMLHLILDNPILEDIEWIVEATSEEKFNLWKEYSKDSQNNIVRSPSSKEIVYDWKQVSEGYGYTIVELETSISKKSPFYKPGKEILPINLDLSFAIINGHKICFYTSNSLLTHHGYIEAFLHTYFQRTHDKYTRWNHTNAANFYNCVGYLETIDKKPRNTEYKPIDREKQWYIFKPICYEEFKTRTTFHKFGL